MESRYDYADPGTDAAYCDGLAPDPEPDEPMSCYYCGTTTSEYDYCSAHCALYASLDSEENQ